MINLKRHLKIIFYFFKFSIVRDLEYRFDFLSNLIASLGWINFTLVLVLVLNRQTGGFGGWTAYEMTLLSGIWMTNNGIAYFFWYRSIKSLIADIHQGKLDFFLTKPFDSQFIISFRSTVTNALAGPIEGVIIILYSLHQLGISLAIADILAFAVLTFCVSSLYYSFWFIAATATIHFPLADNLFFVVPEIVETNKFPQEAFPKVLGQILISVVPLVLMTSFPARLLLHRLAPIDFAYAVCISLLFLFLSRRFWFWSLKRYASAN